MVFMCQKDSYLKEFKSPVISCQQSTMKINGNETVGFDIVLEDTIFFPEGGGQPFDMGFLGDHNVVNVRRDGNRAILFVDSKKINGECIFENGDEPIQKIDWTRRFDHMQQHSGQHLITAVIFHYFNINTTSWCLGNEVCNIELDSKTISNELLNKIEKLVNEKIRENLPIIISYRNPNDLSDISRHMEFPDDINGDIRIISIDTLDKNPCCGTHVKSLGDLQMIKLLGVQKGKKDKTLLFFISGNRVLNYLNNVLQREKLLSSALKCSNEEIVSIVDKLQKNIKHLQKNCTSAIRDLAKLQAELYLKMIDKPKFYSIHRKENEYDFISTFLNTIGKSIDDKLILLSIADDQNLKNSPGQIVIAGCRELVEKSGKIACESIDAKGSLSQGRFRARIPDVSKLSKLEKLIIEML